MTDLAARVSALTPAQRAALLRQVRQSRAGQPGAIARQPRTIPALFPVSFTQQRMWFLEEFNPGTAQHNMPLALALDGPLDTGRLQHALDTLVVRHEALRTTFEVTDGVPQQLVGRPYRVAVAQVDLTDSDEPEAVARVVAAEDAQRGFDLHTGPLWRVTLIKVAPGRATLLLNIHHCAGDGWSTGVLLREFAALYSGAELPEPSLQFADVTVWQRESLTPARLTALLDHWRAELAGTPPLELPVDRPRPALRRYRGALATLTLPLELDPFAKAHGVTVFQTLLAGLQVLLARYSGQRDFAIGTVMAGRDRPELESVVGFMAGTLAVRADIGKGDLGFGRLCELVRDRVLSAYDHAELPFEKLVDELKLPRDTSRAPLFGVMLVLQNTPKVHFDLPGLTVRGLEPDSRAAQFDLTFYVSPVSGGFEFAVEYDTDLFDLSTAQRMAQCLATVLRAAVAQPETPVRLLPLVTTGADLAGRTAYPQKSLGDLVASHEQRANQIARWLLAAGAGPETLVGVGLERGPELIPALLGILRAGAAYVPLDPQYPRQRLELMAADAGLGFAIAQTSTVDRLPLAGCRVLLLDELAPQDTPRPDVAVHPDQLAYVIYTSGTTGRPKGVAVSHRSLVNLLISIVDRCGFDEHTRLLSVTSLSFDIAGLELFAPLLAGGSVTLSGQDNSGAELAAQLASANVMQATPATWRTLLDAGWAGDPALLALCGGEALPADLALRLRDRAGSLWNMYGPTETTIWSLAHPITTDEVTIGGALANTGVEVLDPAQHPMPIGVPGEVWISGDGLARGYLGRPGLTAERFRPMAAGARRYHTGDVARWRTDGALDFLGRSDGQVKVRGYRIELGDIESALRRHPAIRQAAAIVRAEQLVAFVVVEGAEPTAAQLRDHLLATVPAYMVPARFATLPQLPLTPNLKLDRKALPALETELSSGTTFEPPQGLVEETLAGVWAELLGKQRVGRHDNFFTIGGDSLIAVRMVSGAGQQGLSLTTRQVFSHQTLAELAAVTGTVQLLAEQGEVTGPLPLPIATHQFFDGHNPAADFHALAFLLEAREPFDADLLDEVIGDLVRHHDALRIRFTGDDLFIDPYVARRWLEQAQVADEDAVQEWVTRVETGFTMTGGNLFRAILLHLPDGAQRLLLAGHYLVADVVSWQIFASDVDVLYRRRVRGEPYRLPAKTTSMAQWLGRLGEYARSPEAVAQLPYWTAPQRQRAVPIPMDRPDGSNRIAANESEFLVLSVEETAALLAATSKLPLDAVLLGGIARAVTALTHDNMFPVDIYVPGRDTPFEDVDLSRTIGWLTYRYPIWLSLPVDEDATGWVRAIAAQTRAVQHGGLGYPALRYYGEARELAAPPIPEVLFNFFGLPPSGFQTFRPLAGTSGHYHDVESVRMRPLMINGAVGRGQLRMEWEYSADRQDQATIRAMIARCQEFLFELLEVKGP